MTIETKIKNLLGDKHDPSCDIVIDRIVIYYRIFQKASKSVEADGYRIVTAGETGRPIPKNAKYHINSAFPIMNECARQLRQDFELLGISKRGQKLDVNKKVESTLLANFNGMNDN